MYIYIYVTAFSYLIPIYALYFCFCQLMVSNGCESAGGKIHQFSEKSWGYPIVGKTTR